MIPPGDSTQLVAETSENRSGLVIVKSGLPTDQLGFREEHPQYKCCGFHAARRGVKVVAITEWVVNAMLLLIGIILASMRMIRAGTFAGLVVHCMLVSAAAITLWFAVAQYRPRLILFYIGVKIAQIIVLILLLLFALIAFGLSVAMFFAFFSAVSDESIINDDIDVAPAQPSSFRTNVHETLIYSNPGADNINITTSNGAGGKMNPGDDDDSNLMSYKQMTTVFTVTAFVLATLTLTLSLCFLIIAIKCRRYIRDFNFYYPTVTVLHLNHDPDP